MQNLFSVAMSFTYKRGPVCGVDSIWGGESYVLLATVNVLSLWVQPRYGTELAAVTFFET